MGEHVGCWWGKGSGSVLCLCYVHKPSHCACVMFSQCFLSSVFCASASAPALALASAPVLAPAPAPALATASASASAPTSASAWARSVPVRTFLSSPLLCSLCPVPACLQGRVAQAGRLLGSSGWDMVRQEQGVLQLYEPEQVGRSSLPTEGRAT